MHIFSAKTDADTETVSLSRKSRFRVNYLLYRCHFEFMKKLPVGIQDFKTVRNEDYYYVDKSMLIGQILSLNSNGVYSITRPRCFGKSLNLSMLDAFFNIEYKGNTWFDGLEISKHPEYDRYRNAFPVISFSLNLGSPLSFEDFIEKFNSMLKDVFGKFTYLRESPKLDEYTKESFEVYRSGKKSVVDSEYALYELCYMLEEHHDSKVVVLIDDYDATVKCTEDRELRRKIISFLGSVLEQLLKESTSKQLGVMTGIAQVMMANDFGGLNNVMRDDILNTDFGEMYGFTDEEVKQICVDYGHPEKFEEAKEWYGSYHFRNTDVCNPWSVLNYVQNDFKTGLYWAETSGNREIHDIISNADDELIKNLKNLISGGIVKRRVDTIMTSDGHRSAYSLMAVTGYLKAISVGQFMGHMHELSVPNRELLDMFSKIIDSE